MSDYLDPDDETDPASRWELYLIYGLGWIFLAVLTYLIMARPETPTSVVYLSESGNLLAVGILGAYAIVGAVLAWIATRFDRLIQLSRLLWALCGLSFIFYYSLRYPGVKDLLAGN